MLILIIKKNSKKISIIDFLCKSDVIVECKSVLVLTPPHRAQLFNYMRLLKMPCGILVNFLPQYAEIERYFFDVEKRAIVPVNKTVVGHRTS